MGPWYLPTFAGAVGVEADDLHFAILMPPVAVCVDRVLLREDHGFRSEDVTRQMHHEFDRAEVDPRHVLDELPATPAEVAEAVFQALGAGRLSYGGG